MPGPHPQGADLLGFLEQALRKADQPDPAPILDPEGNKYHAHWERGVPLYHKTSVTVHAHPDLGVDGRLGAYECVGPGWQLNVLLTHVPFGEETKDFPDTLSLAYRRLSLLAPTIIIGDLNAAPTDDDRTGPPTATDIAVRDAMHQLGLTDLTAGLTGTPSHYPHQAGTHPSRIDTCYGDPTTVRVHEAAYGDLPPTGTGHRPLYIDLIIPDLPPAAATLPDDTLPPTLQFPAEDDHGAWHRYNRALHAILRRPGAPTLTTAMRRAAQACGMERDTNHTGAPPDLTLQQLVHDIWTTKGELATLLRPSTPEARDRDAHLRALLTTRRHQLQEWHAHRIAAAAQERERYGRNDTPYKSLRYVSRILEDTGRRTIHAVRTPEGGLTNDPDAVLQAVLDSFQAQHGDALPELDPHTRNTIREHVPRVFNREQRRAIEHDPFSISELQRALDRLKKGVVPGVNGLPAEAYQRLTLPIKRRLAARLWDIVTGATPIPPEWANLVHPLYKKGDWAQPGNWRPIVCATTEVKLVWTLIPGRIARAVFAHVPASMWGAMAGRSPHEAIFLQDTALDMNPYEMIIASLDVQGAFPHAPHRLLTEVWDAMGLPFLSFMTGYIQTRLYAVITAAGLTPWTGTDSGVPQGGAEGPFLYLLVTLPLAFELARVYPGYAPYPLRSPLINFADDNLLTTATRHRDPENAGLPTTTEQASAILQLTTTYLDAHQLLVHPRKSVGLADAKTPTPHIRKGEPLHLEDTTVHLGVTQATQHHHITLPSKLEERLARLTQIARGDLLSTQGLAYFMEAVLNAAIGYQALHLPRPQDALRHARQQVTKAWAQHGGWPTSFPKEAMMAHWRYYGDNTGALVDMAYAKHAAHLLHRVTHNHQPEVREAAAIRIKEAQMARNTCPRWILAQHGVSTPVGTGIWAELQLLLPHHTHAILTNHHCDQQGPLVATHTDIHRHPAGEVDTLRLVGATITIVYITPTQMQIMAQCDAHHAPFLSDPQWPARHVFQAYLRACATKAGRDMPGPKDIDTAYTAFQRQHPRPRLGEHETPNDGGTTQGEPTPSAEGWTPPTILLLAPNGHKHATRTVQRHHAPWSIPKHNAPETDVPPVRHSDQGIPRTCWHCGPAALDTPWPLLHLISTHYHTPTAAATADQQAWLSPWFHTVPPDHPAHVAWTRTPTATWTFTNERADPDSVAMEYDRCDPHRAGPQEAPMRPLQHKCPTLRGDKDDTERRQTITCQKFHPNTGYLFHLMYAYITQGRPDRGLLRLTPRAQAIITQGIGVYAAPLLQPTQVTARTTQGNPIYVYHPTAIARLPIPSDTDIIYFTDASGTQQRTPTVGCASVRITRHADGLHVEHHTGTTIFGASSHGELRTMADAVTATPPPTTVRPRNIWVVVDATVDIHLTRRLADLPLHKALDSGLTTQALGLWMAFKGMHPQDALHIVKQESHRYAYGNGRADTQAKHQNTNHTPGLERVRLDTPHHSHLQHLPPIPLAAQPPQWMPEDTPYTDRDKQYHYPTPIQQLAATLGHPANTELLRRLENSVHTPLYYSALRPDSLPAHLQKPRLQLALEQLPLLTRYHRWYTRRSIHVPAGHTKCICGHAEEETWDHCKACPLYRGLDTLTDWNPTHTIAQHAGWLAQSQATQQLTTVLKQTEVLEAVRRGLVPTAVYTLLRTHAEDPQATAAHMQRTAVAKTAEQLTYRTHKYLQHAATLPPTDQAHLLKLLFYQP